jgi:hypothetical protein
MRLGHVQTRGNAYVLQTRGRPRPAAQPVQRDRHAAPHRLDLDARGRRVENLAPYSFFNAVAYVPPQVMFASTSAKPDRDGTKDSVSNIRETGVFCVNIVEYAMKDAMNLTSGPWPREVDEFEKAGIAREECRTIPCSRVANRARKPRMPAHADRAASGRGQLRRLRRGHGRAPARRLPEGRRLRRPAFNPLTRMGYRDYSVIREKFSLKRPGE